jgi:hypothetical protein
MRARRRQSLPPWERHAASVRHPTGRARRRWPRAYDGGVASEPEVKRRYRGRLEQDRRSGAGEGIRRRSTLETLRMSPVRNGLIGLAVVGTATPIAINQYQQALRTDASHERMSANTATEQPVGDAGVADAWSAMEQEQTTAESAREASIEANMERYADFNLTRDLAEAIHDMAVDSDIDPDIAFGLVRAESSFKNSSTSRVGAVGLTQLMPKTAAWLEPGVTVRDLRDQDTNLRIGFRYLKQLIEKYDGNESLALIAYNRGPGTVDRVLKKGGNPDNGYADFVKTGKVGKHKG